MDISRRLFLVRAAALASTVYAAPSFKKYSFSRGVMSGDPSPDGFVLWTRLAPDPLNGGGMPPEPVAKHQRLALCALTRRPADPTYPPALARLQKCPAEKNTRRDGG